MKKIPYILGPNYISFVIDSTPYTINSSDKNYTEILDCVKKNQIEKAISYIDIPRGIKKYTAGNVEMKNNKLFKNGREISNRVVDKINEFIQGGYPSEPLMKFLDNLLENPSRRAVEELYTFLEHRKMPITPEGNFIAYKSVRPNWTDWYSGSIKNTIGTVFEMPRNEVDDDWGRSCGNGIHVGSLNYAKDFHSGEGGHLILVEINPKDVVSFSDGASEGKIRVCKYKVVGEYKDIPDTYIDEDDYNEKIDYKFTSAPKRDSRGRFCKN